MWSDNGVEERTYHLPGFPGDGCTLSGSSCVVFFINLQEVGGMAYISMAQSGGFGEQLESEASRLIKSNISIIDRKN